MRDGFRKLNMNKTVAIAWALFALVVILMGIKYYFFDIYLLSLNGRVEVIRMDIKRAMYITVSKEEYNFSHSWPNFQKQVEVGDSVYKKTKEYELILVKKNTGERIFCEY